MDINLRTLGPAESKVVLTFREQGRTVVRVTDVVDMLGSDNSARKVIRNLLKKGWLSRVVGGRYMFLPPEYGPENLGENNILAMAAAAVEPSYVGWWSAAAWHGFTAQKPMTVFVATKKQVLSQTIEGSTVRFVKITERKFFGFESYDVYGRQVAISSPSKTFLDCLDRPDLAGGPAELTRIAHSALAKVNLDELLSAAITMNSKSMLQRLGFLSDLVDRPLPKDIRTRLKNAIPAHHRSKFGREERRDGDIAYSSSWGLFVNARREDLLSEVPRIKLSETH